MISPDKIEEIQEKLNTFYQQKSLEERKAELKALGEQHEPEG